MTKNLFSVLLYYKYAPIENAEQFAADHLAFTANQSVLAAIQWLIKGSVDCFC